MLLACVAHTIVRPQTLQPGLREDALKLDQPSNAERLKALTTLLRERELKFEALPFANPRQDRDAREQGQNLVVTLGSGARTLIVGAHFDAARLPDGQMSHAIVDNVAGVAVLIHVARALRQHKLKHQVQLSAARSVGTQRLDRRRIDAVVVPKSNHDNIGTNQLLIASCRNLVVLRFSCGCG